MKYATLSALGWFIWAVIAGGVTFGLTFIPGEGWWWLFGAALVVVFLIQIPISWQRTRAIGYALRNDDMVFRRGLMWSRLVAVPYGRLQLVDITRGPIERMVGLATLKNVTAAASTSVTIPGLPFAEAEQLRDHLIKVAETRRAGL